MAIQLTAMTIQSQEAIPYLLNLMPEAIDNTIKSPVDLTPINMKNNKNRSLRLPYSSTYPNKTEDVILFYSSLQHERIGAQSFYSTISYKTKELKT